MCNMVTLLFIVSDESVFNLVDCIRWSKQYTVL